MKSLGIYIKNSHLYKATLEKKSEGFVLEELSSAHIDAKPKDPHFIVEAAQQFSKIEGLKSLNLCFPIDQFTTRTVEFPFKEYFKVKRSLPFYLEEEIPIDPNDLIYEASIYSQSDKSSKALAIAAEADTIITWANYFHSEVSPLNSITFEAWSLANTLIYSCKNHNVIREDQPLAGLFFTGTYLIFIYLENGKLAQTYYSGDPTADLFEDIKQSSGLNPEAIAKISFSNHSPYLSAIKKTFNPQLQKLKAQIQSFAQSHPSLNGCPLFVYSSFESEDFDDYIESQFNNKIFSFKPEALLSSGKIDSYEGLVAMGTALSAYNNKTTDLNFIPKSLQVGQVFLSDLAKKYKSAIFLTLIWMPLIFGYALTKQSLIASNTQKLSDAITESSKGIPYIQSEVTAESYKKFKAYTQKKKKAIAFLEKKSKSQAELSTHLKSLKNHFAINYNPNDLKIKNLEMNSKEIKLSGNIKANLLGKLKAELSNFGTVKQLEAGSVLDAELSPFAFQVNKKGKASSKSKRLKK